MFGLHSNRYLMLISIYIFLILMEKGLILMFLGKISKWCNVKVFFNYYGEEQSIRSSNAFNTLFFK